LGDGEVTEADFGKASLADNAEVEIGMTMPGVLVIELHGNRLTLELISGGPTIIYTAGFYPPSDPAIG
jgi:hypothetical protein